MRKIIAVPPSYESIAGLYCQQSLRLARRLLHVREAVAPVLIAQSGDAFLKCAPHSIQVVTLATEALADTPSRVRDGNLDEPSGHTKLSPTAHLSKRESTLGTVRMPDHIIRRFPQGR